MPNPHVPELQNVTVVRSVKKDRVCVVEKGANPASTTVGSVAATFRTRAGVAHDPPSTPSPQQQED